MAEVGSIYDEEEKLVAENLVGLSLLCEARLFSFKVQEFCDTVPLMRCAGRPVMS